MTEQNDAISRKWERFFEWIHCICIVTFDLELGQAMEVINLILIFFFQLTILIVFNYRLFIRIMLN